MANIYCPECANYEETFNEHGIADWCWYKNEELKCIELTIARNVPPEAYGYCRGFIPIGTDAIVVIQPAATVLHTSPVTIS